MQAFADSVRMDYQDAQEDDFTDLQAPLFSLCKEVESHRKAIAEHQGWLKSMNAINGSHTPMTALCSEVATLKTAVAEQKAWLTSVVEAQRTKIQDCSDSVQDLGRRLECEAQERKLSLRAVQSLADLPLRCEVLQSNLDLSEAHQRIQRLQDSCLSQQCAMEKQITELAFEIRNMDASWRRVQASKDTDSFLNASRRQGSPTSVSRAYDIIARTSPLNTSAQTTPTLLSPAKETPTILSPARSASGRSAEGRAFPDDLARQCAGLQGSSWAKSLHVGSTADSPRSNRSVLANASHIANGYREAHTAVSTISPRIGYPNPKSSGESITSPRLR